MSYEIRNEELEKALEKIAFEKSKPYCYSCQRIVEGSHCPSCGSDDNMRITENGPEYGVDWIIEDLIEENLESVDTDEIFEEMIRDCYSETVKVGWLELDTARCIKEQDPISYDIAKQEYIDSFLDDEQLIEVIGFMI